MSSAAAGNEAAWESALRSHLTAQRLSPNFDASLWRRIEAQQRLTKPLEMQRRELTTAFERQKQALRRRQRRAWAGIIASGTAAVTAVIVWREPLTEVSLSLARELSAKVAPGLSVTGFGVLITLTVLLALTQPRISSRW